VRRLAAAACLLSVLTGCAVGPNYKQPPVNVPDVYRDVQGPPQPAASLADQPWWEVFGDAKLQQLISEALVNGYDAQLAAYRVEEARARAGIARSEFFPQINYGGDWSRGRNSGVVFPNSTATTNLYSVNVNFGWELDIWGRIRRLNEVARANLFAAEDFRRGVWLTLASDLAQAYFELLALDVQLDIARNSTDAYQRTYDLFEDRYQLGAASKLETSRAEGALGGAQANIPQIQSQIVAKENQISVLLGKPPGPIVRGAAMYDQPVVPEVPAGLPSALLARRPDLRQVEEQLVAANARIGVAKADFFPRLSLTALFGTASPEVSALTGGTATIWAAAGMLSGPLLNAGRTLGNYRATVAQWEQARLQYEQAVLTALREVSDALAALGKLSDAETGQNRSVKALAEAVEHATDRYRQGLANYFEVLEAQQQLYPAQNTLAQIRRDRLLAHVRLYKALGGGWSLTDAEWTDPGVAAPR